MASAFVGKAGAKYITTVFHLKLSNIVIIVNFASKAGNQLHDYFLPLKHATDVKMISEAVFLVMCDPSMNLLWVT